MFRKDILLLLTLMLATRTSCSATTRNAKIDSETCQALLRSVDCSRAGIELFFLDTFNSSLYTQHILHSSLTHLLDFMVFARTLERPRDFTTAIFEIFHTRLHSCSWVNPLAFSLFLDQLPNIIGDQCVVTEERNSAKIEALLHTRLLDYCTRMPQTQLGKTAFECQVEGLDAFVPTLVAKITEITDTTKEQAAVYELQMIMTRFCEQALSKCLWDPALNEDTWHSVELLAHQLGVLYDAQVIPSAKILNQLFWALLYRYEYFLTTMRDELSPATFIEIKNSIFSPEPSWLDMPEQELFLQSKREFLKHLLWECEIISQAERDEQKLYYA